MYIMLNTENILDYLAVVQNADVGSILSEGDIMSSFKLDNLLVNVVLERHKQTLIDIEENQ